MKIDCTKIMGIINQINAVLEIDEEDYSLDLPEYQASIDDECPNDILFTDNEYEELYP